MSDNPPAAARSPGDAGAEEFVLAAATVEGQQNWDLARGDSADDLRWNVQTADLHT